MLATKRGLTYRPISNMANMLSESNKIAQTKLKISEIIKQKENNDIIQKSLTQGKQMTH